MNIHPKYAGCRRKGFTLAELILALSVMAIVLTTAATLAFAMGSAQSATNKMGEKQARLRFSTMRIRELARNSCLVFTTDNGVVFWKDDTDANGRISGNEIAWLSTTQDLGAGAGVQIMEFPGETAIFTKTELQNAADVGVLVNSLDEQTMLLLEDCTSASISLDSKVVTVDFCLTENNMTKEYQICGMVRASAEYLLAGGEIVISGDDDL